MKIKKFTVRNFKSYGNSEQKVELNQDKGELILLLGKNGHGKSALISSIDYTLFNKVKGSKKRWVTLSTLPNRINNELFNSITFESKGIEVDVSRGQNPSKLILKENGIVNERAGKKNLDKAIQNYVGMDVETFKSFISMSINDFKNFINLSNEEKKMLLDKLFNLEVINNLNDILKSLNKENKQSIIILDKEIKTFEQSILSIKNSIERTKEIKNVSVSKDIELIKESMISLKESYEALKSKKDKMDSKSNELNNAIQNEKDEAIKLNTEIKQIDKQLNLYELGKCPTCESDLSTDEHTAIKVTFIEKKNKLKELLDSIKERVNYLNTKKSELSAITLSANEEDMNLRSELRTKKYNLEKLVEKQSSKDKQGDLEEFFKAIEDIKSSKESSEKNYSLSKEREVYMKQLSHVFSEDGVKKSIITNILNPINHFIEKSLEIMDVPFQVVLDDTFTASITQFGEEVDHESLSTGETKKVNIAIMIAYLKLIRTKRSINILFLDEVFSSIDIDGIDSILHLLRDFANEYNINIFLVHHSLLNMENFDRVIQINKDIFSTLEEQKIESTYE